MSKPNQEQIDVLNEEAPTMTSRLSTDDQKSLNQNENSEQASKVKLEDIRTAGL
jgi:hypothetical protein